MFPSALTGFVTCGRSGLRSAAIRAATLYALVAGLVGCASSPPLARVPLEPASGAFRDAVPFDVPLLVYGDAPQGATRVTLQYAEEPESGDTVWTKVPGWEPSFPGTADSFFVRLPALKPNKSYVIRTGVERRLTETEAQAFASRAQGVVRSALFAGPVGDWYEETGPGFRRQLADLLVGLTRADQIITEGTIFDPNAPHDRFRTEFVTLVDSALQEVDRRQRKLTQFERDEKRLRLHLERLAAMPVLRQLARGLQVELGNQHAEVRRFVIGHEPAMALLEALMGGRAGRLARGEDSASPELLELGSVMSADEVERVLRRLQATEQQMHGLRAMLRDLDLSQTMIRLVRQGYLTPPQAGRVLRLADESIFDDALEDLTQVQNWVNDIAGHLRRIDAEVTRITAAIDVKARSARLVYAVTRGDFETAAETYFALDGGLLLPTELGDVLPYVGVSAYVRPVNRNAPLDGWDWGRRFSVVVGVTLEGVEEESDPNRRNLVGSRAGVLGAGLLLTDHVRLSGGALLFRRVAPTAVLSDDLELTGVPYGAVSLDIDVLKLLEGVGGLFNALIK